MQVGQKEVKSFYWICKAGGALAEFWGSNNNFFHLAHLNFPPSTYHFLKTNSLTFCILPSKRDVFVFQEVLPKESCVSAKACAWCGEERFCLKRSVAVTFSNAILSKTFEKLSDLEVGETSFTQQTTQKYVYLQIKMKLKILSKNSLKWKKSFESK